MRHKVKGRKLGRDAAHRKAMFSNMAASVLIHKQIKTTEAKAKEARKLVERLITYGKKDTTHSRRLAFAKLRNKEAVKVLFDEVAPTYTNREGGYTRIIKLGHRPNDAAPVVLLQLVGFFGDETKAKKKKAAPAPVKEDKPVEETTPEVKETEAVEEAPEVVEVEDSKEDDKKAEEKAAE